MNVPFSKPFLERKNVILARSGVQLYGADEVRRFGLPQNTDNVKDTYVIMRPAPVIIAAEQKGLFKTLTITKEHPPEFINGSNYQRYTQGTTGENTELVSLENGVIGVKSSLVFSTHEIEDYYLDGNKEVSVGYEAQYEWNPNWKEDGFDIVMVAIQTVNHCAITAAGRGGASVAIIDSIVGGITMLKSGLFHFIARMGRTKDSDKPFSSLVFDALEHAKGKGEEEIKKGMTCVMDSIATLRDSKEKTFLVDAVTDCFKVMDSAFENKEAVSKVLDSAFSNAEKETLDSVPVKTKDGEDGKGKGTANVADSEEEKEEDEYEEESKKKSGKEESGTTDSISALFDAGFANLEKRLPGLINDAIKKELGIAGSNHSGGTTDSTADIPDGVNLQDYLV